MVGKELGLMKNELIKWNSDTIDKAYFLGNKKYGYTFTNKDNQIIDKSKYKIKYYVSNRVAIKH